MVRLRRGGIALIIAGIVWIALFFAAESVIFMECTVIDGGGISCSTRDWVIGNEAALNPLRLFMSLGAFGGSLVLAGGIVLFTRREAPQVSA